MTDNLEIAAKLDEARALIEKGWTRGEFKRRNCYCALGAIAKATTGQADPDAESFPYSSAYQRAVCMLEEAVGDPASIGRPDIAYWNDNQRSKKPVIEAFKKAAALARGETA